MSTISSNVFTLLDYARQIDVNGKLVNFSTMIDNITVPNEALDDILWMECNQGARHITTKLTSKPTGTFRKLNQGVIKSKYTTEQVDVGCAMLEDFFQIDCKLAELNGNSATWRANTEAAFQSGMGETVTNTIFYGTKDKSEQFVGLGAQYAALNDKYFQVLNAGGTGADNTSVYLVGWGSETVHGLFPAGSQAGIKVEDLGRLSVSDGNGGEFMAYKSHFSWDCGLVVRNPKYVVRIANIDVSDLSTAGDTVDSSANLLKLMTVATTKVPSLTNARFAWYANNDVLAMLLVKLMNKTSNQLTIADFMGRPNVVKFMNIPVRRCDLLIESESVVA
jgi:hypothetical protein